MASFSESLTQFSRRASHEVRVGPATIGGRNPVAVQSMTDTDTNDIASTLAQIGRLRGAGCRIVRLTTQGMREAESFGEIARIVRETWPDVALAADVHFQPAVAMALAGIADKVRINPGNYGGGDGNFAALTDKCRQRGTAIRIGVNHGSLSPRIVERWGDTPQGMVASAMEFLRVCRERDFTQAVVSMKSSNVRVMVHAYRLLAAAMRDEGMSYPLHLGVTEAGCGIDGRVKSAAGIGALLSDGLGDTIRVSLTEPPENEIPVALELAGYFAGRETCPPAPEIADPGVYRPFEYHPRRSTAVGRIGGTNPPVLYGELGVGEKSLLGCGIALPEGGCNPPAAWRAAALNMLAAGDRRPLMLQRKYDACDPEILALRAAADFGPVFIDGLADGIRLECPGAEQPLLDKIALSILQASRLRMSRAEFIACPGCGRTLFDLAPTLARIEAATSHLAGLKIGVMGCIVNGPGEMADADYGYVGAGPGKVTLYRGRSVVRRAVPQEEALDALLTLLREDGYRV